MKIYFAGSPGTIEREILWLKRIRKRLLSYHYIQQDQFAMVDSFNLIKKRNEEEVTKE